MIAIGGEPFDGGDLFAFDIRQRGLAGKDGLAVDMHGARAAQTGTAAEFRAGHFEMFAERPEQWRVAFCADGLRFSVNGKSNHDNISFRLSEFRILFSRALGRAAYSVKKYHRQTERRSRRFGGTRKFDVSKCVASYAVSPRRDTPPAPADRCAASLLCRFRRSARLPRSEIARLCFAFCSTVRMPTLGSRTLASDLNNSLHSNGDKPSDGSSSSRISGAVIIARPMATICCSPPLMVRTVCLRRSARTGNRSSIFSILTAACARALFGLAPSRKFSWTDNSPKTPRPSGTRAIPVCSSVGLSPREPFIQKQDTRPTRQRPGKFHALLFRRERYRNRTVDTPTIVVDTNFTASRGARLVRPVLVPVATEIIGIGFPVNTPFFRLDDLIIQAVP
jgi:hypothetical protein